MKTNHQSWNKGWRSFILFVILVLQIFYSEKVLADEESLVLEGDLKSSSEGIEGKEEEIDAFGEIVEEQPEIEVNEENVFVLTKEDIWNHYSTDMEFSEDKVVVFREVHQGMIAVGEVLECILLENLKKDYDVSAIYIINEEGVILEHTDLLMGRNSIVIIGDGYLLSYSLEVLGDYTNDGIINGEDVESALDLNLNHSEGVTTENVSYVDALVKDNTSEEPSLELETLEEVFEFEQEDCYVGEEVVLKYSVKGFDWNYINTISGEIQYDHDALELVDFSILADGEVKVGIRNQYFISLLEEYKDSDPLLVFRFQTKRKGLHQVTLNQMKLVMNGNLLMEEHSIGIEFLVQEYGKGGDVDFSAVPEEVVSPSIENTVVTPISPNLSNAVTTLSKPSVTEVLIYLSNDNYIEDLAIDGYSLVFDKYQEEYQIEVFDDIDQLDLEVFLSSEEATYFVTGNENFKEGMNPVVLTVQAEDGSIRNYTIYVKKTNSQMAKEEVEFEEWDIHRSVSMIILGFLILSIIWCLYLFIKKED